MNLSGKTALLTGATAGIGHETLKALTAKGCAMIVLGRESERLVALENQPGIKTVYRCDLENLNEVETVVRKIAEAHPDIDVLINNAGIQQEMLFDDLSSTNTAIATEVAVNFIAPLYLIRGLLPNLRARPQAAIVNVTSSLALVPKTKSAVYCGTKGGLRIFSKSLRNQLADTNVTVCEILPFLVDTAMTEGRGSDKIKIAPSVVADSIVNALERDSEEVYVDKAKLLYWLDRILPGLAGRVMKRAG